MSEKQKKPVMTQEENDRMMNRLMLAFVAAVGAVTVIMSVKNRCNTIVLYETAAPVMVGVTLALFILSAVFYFIRMKKKIDDSKSILTKENVLGCGITALFCGLIYAVNPSIASGYSVVIIIGACVLYFIRYIYPLSFLAIAFFCLCEGLLIHAGFGLAAVRSFSVILSLLFRIIAVVLPIVFFAAAKLAQKKKSVWYKGARPWALYLCTGVALLGAAVLWLGTLGIFYVSYIYILYLLGAVLLACGIIETVKSI